MMVGHPERASVGVAADAPAREESPKVSIGVPVHNGRRYLRAALDSLAEQTYTNLEIVIVDNASTDGSREIIAEFARREPRAVTYFSDVNRGAAWSHNETFWRSTGQYFRWATHDDVSAPTYVQRCVEALESHPAAVLAAPSALEIDEVGDVLFAHPDIVSAESADPVSRFGELLFEKYPCHEIYGLVRSDVLRRTQLIGYYTASDRTLLAELALHGPYVRVREPLFRHRQHEERSVRAIPDRFERAVWFDSRLADRWIVAPAFQWFGAYLEVVRRAPLPAAARARCTLLLAKWAAVQWRYFAGDVKHSAHRISMRVRKRG